MESTNLYTGLGAMRYIYRGLIPVSPLLCFPSPLSTAITCDTHRLFPPPHIMPRSENAHSFSFNLATKEAACPFCLRWTPTVVTKSNRNGNQGLPHVSVGTYLCHARPAFSLLLSVLERTNRRPAGTVASSTSSLLTWLHTVLSPPLRLGTLW